MTDSVRAMRCFTRRSGLLRTQPLRVFALREPPAIASHAQATLGFRNPSPDTGARKSGTQFVIEVAVYTVCTLYAISLWVVR